jgi:hypothetical protein
VGPHIGELGGEPLHFRAQGLELGADIHRLRH